MAANKEELDRCPWVDLSKPDYVAYHDEEWGVPVHDDRKLFEFLTLESAQAGLSWYTVLKKRENYRRAFAGFDVQRVAEFGDEEVSRLVQNAGIIRNRAKILAAITNAQKFITIQTEFGSFDHFIWGFVDAQPIVNERATLADYPSTSPESDALSDALRTRGLKFVGSTICYALMQAIGMVNDHSANCFRRGELLA